LAREAIPTRLDMLVKPHEKLYPDFSFGKSVYSMFIEGVLRFLASFQLCLPLPLSVLIRSISWHVCLVLYMFDSEPSPESLQ